MALTLAFAHAEASHPDDLPGRVQVLDWPAPRVRGLLINTPWCIARKDERMVRYLLSRGADANLPADRLLRPLSLAVAIGCDQTLIELLLAAGADLEAPDVKGFRPLHTAAEVGTVSAIRFLHVRGASPTVRTSNGLLPIHIACALGHLDAAKELVSLGADPRAESQLGTPLEIARGEGKREVASWLEGASR